MHSRQGGFTLVELMIVVAILGLLAAMALPSFSSAREKSMRNTCISHLTQISGAKDQYALSHNGLAPAALDDLIPDIIRHRPVCPAGGTFLLGDLQNDPTCDRSAAGHTI